MNSALFLCQCLAAVVVLVLWTETFAVANQRLYI